MCCPMAVEPVKETSGMSGCLTIAVPALGPTPNTKLHTPGGRPATTTTTTTTKMCQIIHSSCAQGSHSFQKICFSRNFPRLQGHKYFYFFPQINLDNKVVSTATPFRDLFDQKYQSEPNSWQEPGVEIPCTPTCAQGPYFLKISKSHRFSKNLLFFVGIFAVLLSFF